MEARGYGFLVHSRHFLNPSGLESTTQRADPKQTSRRIYSEASVDSDQTELDNLIHEMWNMDPKPVPARPVPARPVPASSRYHGSTHQVVEPLDYPPHRINNFEKATPEALLRRRRLLPGSRRSPSGFSPQVTGILSTTGPPIIVPPPLFAPGVVSNTGGSYPLSPTVAFPPGANKSRPIVPILTNIVDVSTFHAIRNAPGSRDRRRVQPSLLSPVQPGREYGVSLPLITPTRLPALSGPDFRGPVARQVFTPLSKNDQILLRSRQMETPITQKNFDLPVLDHGIPRISITRQTLSPLSGDDQVGLTPRQMQAPIRQRNITLSGEQLDQLKRENIQILRDRMRKRTMGMSIEPGEGKARQDNPPSSPQAKGPFIPRGRAATEIQRYEQPMPEIHHIGGESAVMSAPDPVVGENLGIESWEEKLREEHRNRLNTSPRHVTLPFTSQEPGSSFEPVSSIAPRELKKKASLFKRIITSPAAVFTKKPEQVSNNKDLEMSPPDQEKLPQTPKDAGEDKIRRSSFKKPTTKRVQRRVSFAPQTPEMHLEPRSPEATSSNRRTLLAGLRKLTRRNTRQQEEDLDTRVQTQPETRTSPVPHERPRIGDRDNLESQLGVLRPRSLDPTVLIGANENEDVLIDDSQEVLTSLKPIPDEHQIELPSEESVAERIWNEGVRPGQRGAGISTREYASRSFNMRIPPALASKLNIDDLFSIGGYSHKLRVPALEMHNERYRAEPVYYKSWEVSQWAKLTRGLLGPQADDIGPRKFPKSVYEDAVGKENAIKTRQTLPDLRSTWISSQPTDVALSYRRPPDSVKLVKFNFSAEVLSFKTDPNNRISITNKHQLGGLELSSDSASYHSRIERSQHIHFIFDPIPEQSGGNKKRTAKMSSELTEDPEKLTQPAIGVGYPVDVEEESANMRDQGPDINDDLYEFSDETSDNEEMSADDHNDEEIALISDEGFIDAPLTINDQDNLHEALSEDSERQEISSCAILEDLIPKDENEEISRIEYLHVQGNISAVGDAESGSIMDNKTPSLFSRLNLIDLDDIDDGIAEGKAHTVTQFPNNEKIELHQEAVGKQKTNNLNIDCNMVDSDVELDDALDRAFINPGRYQQSIRKQKQVRFKDDSTSLNDQVSEFDRERRPQSPLMIDDQDNPSSLSDSCREMRSNNDNLVARSEVSDTSSDARLRQILINTGYHGSILRESPSSSVYSQESLPIASADVIIRRFEQDDNESNLRRQELEKDHEEEDKISDSPHNIPSTVHNQDEVSGKSTKVITTTQQYQQPVIPTSSDLVNDEVSHEQHMTSTIKDDVSISPQDDIVERLTALDAIFNSSAEYSANSDAPPELGQDFKARNARDGQSGLISLLLVSASNQIFVNSRSAVTRHNNYIQPDVRAIDVSAATTVRTRAYFSHAQDYGRPSPIVRDYAIMHLSQFPGVVQISRLREAAAARRAAFAGLENRPRSGRISLSSRMLGPDGLQPLLLPSISNRQNGELQAQRRTVARLVRRSSMARLRGQHLSGWNLNDERDQRRDPFGRRPLGPEPNWSQVIVQRRTQLEAQQNQNFLSSPIRGSSPTSEVQVEARSSSQDPAAMETPLGPTLLADESENHITEIEPEWLANPILDGSFVVGAESPQPSPQRGLSPGHPPFSDDYGNSSSDAMIQFSLSAALLGSPASHNFPDTRPISASILDDDESVYSDPLDVNSDDVPGNVNLRGGGREERGERQGSLAKASARFGRIFSKAKAKLNRAIFEKRGQNAQVPGTDCKDNVNLAVRDNELPCSSTQEVPATPLSSPVFNDALETPGSSQVEHRIHKPKGGKAPDAILLSNGAIIPTSSQGYAVVRKRSAIHIPWVNSTHGDIRRMVPVNLNKPLPMLPEVDEPTFGSVPNSRSWVGRAFKASAELEKRRKRDSIAVGATSSAVAKKVAGAAGHGKTVAKMDSLERGISEMEVGEEDA